MTQDSPAPTTEPTWFFNGLQMHGEYDEFSFELWTNIRPYKQWTEPGFTLSRQTIEQAGYALPNNPKVGQRA